MSARKKPSHRDPRELPNYSVPEAARYLRIPPSTIRAWMIGQPGSQPVVRIARREPPSLSFFNMVELHVLDAMRQERVRLPAIRRALAYVETTLEVQRPLVHEQFQTDGLDLFVEHFGKLINASGKGQIAMRAVLKDYLRRVEFDRQHVARQLFPLADRLDVSDRRPVVFDPSVSFGRLVITGTGIPTDIIGSRNQAGETAEELAEDYGLTLQQIEDALTWEKKAA